MATNNPAHFYIDERVSGARCCCLECAQRQSSAMSAATSRLDARALRLARHEDRRGRFFLGCILIIQQIDGGVCATAPARSQTPLARARSFQKQASCWCDGLVCVHSSRAPCGRARGRRRNERMH